MHSIITRKDLPVELRQPGAAGDVILPTANDPVGERFYSLVRRLMSEPGAYADVGAFSNKLERFLENTQRWAVINEEPPEE